MKDTFKDFIIDIVGENPTNLDILMLADEYIMNAINKEEVQNEIDNYINNIK